MVEFDIKNQERSAARIKVIGVGGGGGNTVNSMIDANLDAIDFIVANTDAQALALSQATTKIQLGIKSTKGLGTGANPELGKRAAEEDLSELIEQLSDANIVFLTGGLGGGTGSGALPVIARALKEKNILSIAVVTKPFNFEGKRREKVAQEAIQLLRKEVDTLLIIPNQKLLELVDKSVSMIDAFSMINTILTQSVKGISDIIAKPGHINVDFADVRTIMKDMGLAVMGTGKARGVERALQAATQAISSPLLENMSIKGAKGVLLNISGGLDLALCEISEAADVITREAALDATIIIGSVIDTSLDDEVLVTVIATGFVQANELHDNVAVGYKPAIDQSVKPDMHRKVAPAQDYYTENVKNAKQEQAVLLAADSAHGYDLDPKNDLDIPTFMRQEQSTMKDS